MQYSCLIQKKKRLIYGRILQKNSEGLLIFSGRIQEKLSQCNKLSTNFKPQKKNLSIYSNAKKKRPKFSEMDNTIIKFENDFI
ncbi:hypothetical protein AYI68_g2124 [Smittium mucronatum]|uniref:Uncharacterized protein n=1 Tax=Smittium mucronatum TaxID=133383 RepID=A0A1R0H3N3_9FUNG|nr:hypothetical protein AYI68_g2124 [Smittium mucronatum]